MVTKTCPAGRAASVFAKGRRGLQLGEVDGLDGDMMRLRGWSCDEARGLVNAAGTLSSTDSSVARNASADDGECTLERASSMVSSAAHGLREATADTRAICDSGPMRIKSGFTMWMLLVGPSACGSSDGSGASAGSSETSGSTGPSQPATTVEPTGATASSATTDTGSTGTTSETSDTRSTGDTGSTGETGSTSGTGSTESTSESTGNSDSTGDSGTTGGVVELEPGALQFIGVNSDLPEGFALVALTDVPAGTELRFTERAWNETTGAFETPEGTGSLVLSDDVAAGTVFEVGVSGPSTLSITPNLGSIANDDTGNWGIAGNGDNLFVYTGSDDAPTFLAGVAFSAPSVWTDDADALDGQSSMIPSSLSEAAGTITTFDADNLRYTGARTGEGSLPAYLPLVADEMNYETGNAAYTPLAGTDFTL